MKLLTLNTHSWQEADNASCLLYTASAIEAEQPDVIALQEVNQREQGVIASPGRLASSGYVDGGFPIEEKNWALLLAERLREDGHPYSWSWSFSHVGYRTWAEGVALLSKSPIQAVRCADVSAPSLPADSWRRRRILAIHNEMGWFGSAHMGWWNDEADPFQGQWERLNAFTKTLGVPCYLMGDFNCPAHVRQEGYDLMLSSGWQDCYARAEEKDCGVTVPGQIDGWRSQQVDGFRLDLCLAAQTGRTARSRVIFNGDFYPSVSDHFGVLTEEIL
ncbi:MAG: endonuclease/exonuclease/phosphatase family protein [Clostridia bacterium]|nr:endonuclease/exonuclease/phosphatase family protein [Clostridia bacterium]